VIPTLGILGLVHLVFRIFYVIIVIRAIGSFMPRPPAYSPWGKLLGLTYTITEPLLGPLRKVLDPYQRSTRLDFSPFVLLILMSVVEGLLGGIR
jgi:YggT family protein